jgi:hypothetical protein
MGFATQFDVHLSEHELQSMMDDAGADSVVDARSFMRMMGELPWY